MSQTPIFHLAIPCRDLEEARRFYTELGAVPGRSYSSHLTLNFYGAQLVCHLSPDAIEPSPSMYPRHFGVNFLTLAEYQAMVSRIEALALDWFKAPFVRAAGKPEEHHSCFVLDPSHNVIEFKHYLQPACAH